MSSMFGHIEDKDLEKYLLGWENYVNEADSKVADEKREAFCKIEPKCSKDTMENNLPSVLMRAILLLDGFVLSSHMIFIRHHFHLLSISVQDCPRGILAKSWQNQTNSSILHPMILESQFMI